MDSRYALLKKHLNELFYRHEQWESQWESFPGDPGMATDNGRFEETVATFFERLKDNYPFFHPDYAGQMLKPPHEVAVFAYLSAMLINPNNHALDGGPATADMEKEVVADLAKMFGYQKHLGHLTSSGTIANLEALWIASREHPGASVAFSNQSHYTHKRMCDVLGVRTIEVPSNSDGRMSVEALRTLLLSENIGTVVVTLGTTGLGAIDPLDDILALRENHEFRIHVDAAYGGFFRLLADRDEPTVRSEPYLAVSEADSIVVDPHKHGMQPYGCGCVLFRDPEVGQHYKHDSPYTYFTSDDLHLGEISLECSRAGASAAALWFTLQCFPLDSYKGLGAILDTCRMAALCWANLLRTSEELYLLLEPELDIVCFFPQAEPFTVLEISKRSDMLFRYAMAEEERPVYLSKLRVSSDVIAARYPDVKQDAPWTTILRSSLMKPEHLRAIPRIHSRLETFCRRLPVSEE
jgi:glutamate/tyrosine decarboxylase-like PLP-dependent enzyme